MGGFRALATLAVILPAMAQPPQGQIDTTNFVVLGEGLAAGYANFALHQVNQENSFPAIMARQMKAGNFPQPQFQAPGLGNIAGFPGLPARVPGTLQNTVRVPGGPKPTGRVNAQPPFALFVFNVSIPGLKLADALSRRPVPPMVQPKDPQQTLINMILGFPGMITGVNKPLWTAAEYVREMNPSIAMVALGYYDFVDAVANADAGLLPDAAQFRSKLNTILTTIRPPGTPIVIANVPDPLDTAFVSSLDTAAALLTSSAADLQRLFRLRADDLITIPGLITMGSQMLSGHVGTLPSGSILGADFANAERGRIRDINAVVADVAQQNGTPLVDLQAVFAAVQRQGITAAGQPLTADFQGGLYSLDGFYPGATMQTLIANQALAAINKAFGMNYPNADVDAAAQTDPAGRLVPFRRSAPKKDNQ